MVPPNKAAKTASNVTASNAALPAALAPVQARMALSAQPLFNVLQALEQTVREFAESIVRSA